MTTNIKPRLVIRGDTHDSNPVEGYEEEFSGLYEHDTLLVLGDTAIGWPDYDDDTLVVLEEIESYPFTTIYLFGNHDNYDYAETLPIADNGMRQVVFDGKTYERQFIVDKPMIADVAGYHCLLIPGADSHDIDYLFMPEDMDGYRLSRYQGRLSRVIGVNWWPQEAIDTTALYKLLRGRSDEHFDLVLSHDAPAHFTNIASPHGGAGYRMRPTVGERYLEALYESIDYDYWFHGHFHYDFFPYTNPTGGHDEYDSCCLYHIPYEVEELKGIMAETYKKEQHES